MKYGIFYNEIIMKQNKILTKQQIIELRAKAQALSPVVMIGQKGLTEAVIAQTDGALKAHELIKVRVLGDDRQERVAIGEALWVALQAHLVQHIGKLLVSYRERQDKTEV